MDDRLLIETLKRLESKVDQLSTGLATNTAVTESHTRMLGEMKTVHDLNARVILETKDHVQELQNALKRIESWKDGQTLYQQKAIEEINGIKSRLSPVEIDYLARMKAREENAKNFKSIIWKGIERALMWITIGFLLPWKTLLNKIFFQ
jgi:hypothetical protein